MIRGYDFRDSQRAGDIIQMGGNVDAHKVSLREQWPEARSTAAPPDCPANVASFFQQAANSLNGGNFDAAGMMFRKSLEAATKNLAPNAKANNLADRIKGLVTSHVLTPALGDWANEVRLGGNDAAHDDEPFTQKDAEGLHHFTENFLNYSFTMPAAVARRASPTQA